MHTGPWPKNRPYMRCGGSVFFEMLILSAVFSRDSFNRGGTLMGGNGF